MSLRLGTLMSMTMMMMMTYTQQGEPGPSGLERRTGDRVVLGSNPAGGTSLRNFGKFVYPALPVPVGGDSKSRRSLLSGV